MLYLIATNYALPNREINIEFMKHTNCNMMHWTYILSNNDVAKNKIFMVYAIHEKSSLSIL